MENLTIIGMKELNQKISRIDRSLNGVNQSLAQIAKIMNRQVPPAQRAIIEEMRHHEEHQTLEDNEDEM